ncbi:MAG TPA: T9SS type A sorting domain-containing protein, partial [Bacteroidota bacterium]|nr:T9SS type A sorting domain-containing protein [Bacteroidota bacterium]
LSARCDSMFLVDKTGQLTSDGTHPIGTIDMFTQDSLFIFQPLQVFATFKITIYKYGVHLVDSLTGSLLTVTSVQEVNHLVPSSFKLLQNYPNPFNPTTQISYTLARASTVTLTIYDILGREVTTLVNEKQEPGNHSVSWNALTVPSGVYFYTLRSGIEHDVKKLIILR